jgi:hypothetical protein
MDKIPSGIWLIAIIWTIVNLFTGLIVFITTNSGLPSECNGHVPINWSDMEIATLMTNLCCMIFIWTFRKRLARALNI